LSSIPEEVERAAAKWPEALAISHAGGDLTFRELNRVANRLARFLRAHGCSNEDLVGVALPRGPMQIASLLAILKANGAYVPLDVDYPTERLQHMIRDSALRLVVTDSATRGRLPLMTAKVVCIDQSDREISSFDSSNLEHRASGGDLAYCIYTSGSTGLPKGVLVPHRGVCEMAKALERLLEPQIPRKVLQFASLSFDVSVWEIFPTLLMGATLHILDRDPKRIPPASLISAAVQNGVDCITVPPSYLALAAPGETRPPRILIVAGEACPPYLVKTWAPLCRFINAYGPTETVGAVLAGDQDPAKDVTLGRPFPYVRTRVVDHHGELVKPGERGELYIGGPSVARGYLNRPALTAERFVPDPAGGSDSTAFYRTGDLVRTLDNGEMVFGGRIDSQVKVRGYRIELGEIEAVLARHPQVHEAVVVQGPTAPGDGRLVAFVRSEAQVASDSLMIHARSWLPSWMIPCHFGWVKTWPLTPNGKVDRLELSRRASLLTTTTEAIPSDRLDVAAVIRTTWIAVLGCPTIEPDEDFFDLGGHSLLAVEIAVRLHRLIGVEIPLDTFFTHPTLAEFTKCAVTIRDTSSVGNEPSHASL
jgi:amino acid adenylation domain-containing protein